MSWRFPSPKSSCAGIEKNKVLEPMEEVIISVPDEYTGSVISKLNLRKGVMREMGAENGYTRMEYLVPTRGLLGYRTEFINDTRGEGTMVQPLRWI